MTNEDLIKLDDAGFIYDIEDHTWYDKNINRSKYYLRIVKRYKLELHHGGYGIMVKKFETVDKLISYIGLFREFLSKAENNI